MVPATAASWGRWACRRWLIPKKYAVVCGTRALIARPLEDVDEVWLVGECACRADHQFPGYMDKINAANKVVKLGACPGYESLYHGKYGGIYDHPMLASVDMTVSAYLPDVTRPNVVARTNARREGRETEFKKGKKLTIAGEARLLRAISFVFF